MKQYRSEKTKQAKTNNLIYLINPKSVKVHRLFVLSYENKDDKRSFSKN